ncbi:MAG: hypothetical protein WDN48_18100 [Pseudolabrys sp.]
MRASENILSMSPWLAWPEIAVEPRPVEQAIAALDRRAVLQPAPPQRSIIAATRSSMPCSVRITLPMRWPARSWKLQAS